MLIIYKFIIYIFSLPTWSLNINLIYKLYIINYKNIFIFPYNKVYIPYSTFWVLQVSYDAIYAINLKESYIIKKELINKKNDLLIHIIKNFIKKLVKKIQKNNYA